eukprot:12761920-Alexandrium_andersonii.AAC.1
MFLRVPDAQILERAGHLLHPRDLVGVTEARWRAGLPLTLLLARGVARRVRPLKTGHAGGNILSRIICHTVAHRGHGPRRMGLAD